MRYLHQQLLAFCSIILVTMLTVGIAFTQMTKQTIEDNNYKQLFGYASAAAEEMNRHLPADSLEAVIQQALSTSEAMLDQQDVAFLFVRQDGAIVYPIDTDKPIDIPFKDYWSGLQNGQKQQETTKYDMYGAANATSYAMIPFNLDNDFYGALVVTQPAQNVQNSVKEFTWNLMRGFLLALILSLIISYLFASFQVHRINRMKQATKEISNGNFDIVLPVHNRDEFDELAEDFNKMSDSLKKSQEEIDRQEERRRQFMADASHEMRTPLTTINGLLEGLEYHAIPEESRDDAIRLMKNETNRLIRLVNENLDYEKIRTNQISIIVKKFDGTAALQTIVTQLSAKAKSANDCLILDTQESVSVFADYDRFVQIMVNIIQNSIQFTKDGQIHVKIEKGYLETIVTISDTGIGMSEDQVRNIWDRYYKVDPSRKNPKFGESGLGLPIVQQLVRLHKGTIDVQSKLNEGTTFTIRFPDVEIKDEETE